MRYFGLKLYNKSTNLKNSYIYWSEIYLIDLKYNFVKAKKKRNLSVMFFKIFYSSPSDLKRHKRIHTGNLQRQRFLIRDHEIFLGEKPYTFVDESFRNRIICKFMNESTQVFIFFAMRLHDGVH